MTEPKRIYPWKRFWVPLGGAITLDGAFLRDPEQHRLFRADVRPWSEVARRRCLALLGEPNLGKSTALVQAGLNENTPSRLYLNLNGYGTAEQIHDNSFGSPKFRTWLNGDESLELTFDSLDECLVHVRTLASWLIEQLERIPDDRRRSLMVRVACRIAEWPALLAEQLPRLFKDDFVAFELAPLRRVDVLLAAQEEGLDSTAFLEQIDLSGAGPLAAVPATLEFLLGEFRTSRSLTADRVELYRRGFLHLASEHNKARRASGSVPELEPSELVSVAERIAAAIVFGRRTSIYLGPNANAAPDDLLPSQLKSS